MRENNNFLVFWLWLAHPTFNREKILLSSRTLIFRGLFFYAKAFKSFTSVEQIVSKEILETRRWQSKEIKKKLIRNFGKRKEVKLDINFWLNFKNLKETKCCEVAFASKRTDETQTIRRPRPAVHRKLKEMPQQLAILRMKGKRAALRNI